MMIPPSATYGVPGADDETIFADIVKNLERDRDDVGRALAASRRDLAGGAFADLDAERRAEVATLSRGGGAPLAASSAWCCFATTATTG